MWSAKLKSILTVIAVALALMVTAARALEPGDPLPDWASFELEGEVPNLDGKVVMIDVWASWCAPCKAISPTLDELSEELGGKIKIAKVNVDENQQLANESSTLKGGFQLSCDFV